MQEKLYNMLSHHLFLSFYGSHVSKVYVIQVENTIDMERWRFLFLFFQTCHLGRENNSLFCNSDRRQTAHGIADWAAKSKLTNPGGEETYHRKGSHRSARFLGFPGVLLLLSSSQDPADNSLASQMSQKGKTKQNNFIIRKRKGWHRGPVTLAALVMMKNQRERLMQKLSMRYEKRRRIRFLFITSLLKLEYSSKVSSKDSLMTWGPLKYYARISPVAVIFSTTLCKVFWQELPTTIYMFMYFGRSAMLSTQIQILTVVLHTEKIEAKSTYFDSGMFVQWLMKTWCINLMEWAEWVET